MRIAVLGGTIFIGRAIVEELVDAGHEVLVVHRGEHEPEDMVEVEHLHVARADLATQAGGLKAFRPDALVDTSAGTKAHAEAALAAVDALGGDLRLLVLSSMDTYRAYGGLHAQRYTDAVPIDEASPVRPERYPYRGQMPNADDYEKLDVEEAYVARGGTVCRLPIVYGPRDYQRREWPVLRRVAAGRDRIPIGSGTILISRGYVADLAVGVRLALEAPVEGEIFNLCETPCATVEGWWRQILAAAGSAAELVRVPNDALPPDLQLGGENPQPLLVSAAKARDVLGWSHRPPEECIPLSVRWHLDHPPAAPEGGDPGFDADDAALAAAEPVDAAPAA